MPDDVGVIFLGPGEEITPSALQRAARELAPADVGAVQLTIRAATTQTLLAQLQDLEWVGTGELHAAGPAAAYRVAALRDLPVWPSGEADDSPPYVCSPSVV